MANKIEVYACGQKIKLGNKGSRNVDAEITAIIIRPSYVRYEATWWEDSKRNEIWVNREDFTTNTTTKKIKVGFKGN